MAHFESYRFVAVVNFKFPEGQLYSLETIIQGWGVPLGHFSGGIVHDMADDRQYLICFNQRLKQLLVLTTIKHYQQNLETPSCYFFIYVNQKPFIKLLQILQQYESSYNLLVQSQQQNHNRITRKWCGTCSKLTIKTPERRH